MPNIILAGIANKNTIYMYAIPSNIKTSQSNIRPCELAQIRTKK